MFWSVAKVTENTVAGNVVVLLKATRRDMSITTEYHDADALARSYHPSLRLIDTGESVDGYAQRRYYANVPVWRVEANDDSGEWSRSIDKADAINSAQHLSLDNRGVTFSVIRDIDSYVLATFTHGFRDEKMESAECNCSNPYCQV